MRRKICKGGSKDLVRIIDPKGSIFSIGKKREISSSMLVAKDGDQKELCS